MNVTEYTISELIELYSSTIKELKKRGVLRTKNVVGEIGEHLVFDYYYKNPNLPNLSAVPLGTKNINALSENGDRYSIKTSTEHVTGVFYGMQPPGSLIEDNQTFEYVVVCKMSEDYELEGIYQLDWKTFLKHKKWHSRMNAWNLAITNALKQDAEIIFEKSETSSATSPMKKKSRRSSIKTTKTERKRTESGKAVKWNKTKKIKHSEVKEKAADIIGNAQGEKYSKTSQSCFVSDDKERALYIMSANYSKNNEYWYSIADDNLPWLALFPECKIVFALGSSKHLLTFTYTEFEEMLKGCLRTKEDLSIGKIAHYHIAFAPENNGRVYFKKKLPEHDFIDVTDHLFVGE